MKKRRLHRARKDGTRSPLLRIVCEINGDELWMTKRWERLVRRLEGAT